MNRYPRHEVTLLDSSKETDAGYVPPRTGFYQIVIGASPTVWASGTVSVKQFGGAFEDLSAITAFTRKRVHLMSGEPLAFAMTGHGGTAHVNIAVAMEDPQEF